MISVCTQEDEYTRELWLSSARWTAYLSNGETVIQDDDRVGLTTPSAWLRLGDYVKENKLKIQTFYIQFRNESPICLPNDADGYFFRRSIGAYLNTGDSFSFFLIGHLENNVIHVRRYKVPEMIFVEKHERDPEDLDNVGPSLIRNISP